MFETAILSYNDNAPRRVWTTCMGVTGQALLVLGAVMVPMIWPQVLPPAQSLLQVFLPTVPPAPPAPPPDMPRTTHVTPTHPFQQIDGRVMLPQNIPNAVAEIIDPAGAEELARSNRIGAGSGVPGGLPDLFRAIGTMPQIAAPAHVEPPSVRAVSDEPIHRYRVGGVVKMARLVHRVEPVYPPLARTAHVSGAVVLEGVIGVDGRIRELKVRGGHPFLVSAAVEAVRQWVYEPTTLNGDPVEVIAPISVIFRLAN